MIEPTDEDLSLRHQAGDPAVANVLVDRYWDQAELIAREYPMPDVCLDDRHMEAIQGLLKAIDGWRPGRGSKFKTFAKLAMRRILIDLWRRRNQQGQIPAAMKRSLDMPTTPDSVQTLADIVADDVDVFEEVDRRIMAEAAASATLKAHREVLFGIAHQYDQAEIAAYLGIKDVDVSYLMAFNRAIGRVLVDRTPAWAA